jgi:hypothetical protein
MSDPSQAPQGPERRKLERAPTTLRGKVFPGGLDCVIKDFNRGGARLQFAGPPPSDDALVVVIWSSGIAIEAVGCWRGGFEMGVRSLRRFDMRGRVPERLLEVKAQWLERRRRLRRSQLKDCPAMIDYRGSPSTVQLS